MASPSPSWMARTSWRIVTSPQWRSRASSKRRIASHLDVPDDELSLVPAGRGEHAVRAERDGVQLADSPLERFHDPQRVRVPEPSLPVPRGSDEEASGGVNGKAAETRPPRR